MTKLYKDDMNKKIFEAIIEILKEENYQVGSQIPTEAELGSRLGVSRNSIREVSKSLSLWGITKSIPGKGTFLQKELSTLEDGNDILPKIDGFPMQEIVDVRRMIEVEAAGIVAAKGKENPEILEPLRTLWNQCEDSSHINNNLQEFEGKMRKFHATIIDMSGNNLLKKLYQSIINEIQEVRRLYPPEEKELTQELKRHRNIYKAIIQGDVDKSRVAMYEHFIGTQAAYFRKTKKE